jgi:hypothetical protein
MDTFKGPPPSTPRDASIASNSGPASTLPTPRPVTTFFGGASPASLRCSPSEVGSPPLPPSGAFSARPAISTASASSLSPSLEGTTSPAPRPKRPAAGCSPWSKSATAALPSRRNPPSPRTRHPHPCTRATCFLSSRGARRRAALPETPPRLEPRYAATASTL